MSRSRKYKGYLTPEQNVSFLRKKRSSESDEFIPGRPSVYYSQQQSYTKLVSLRILISSCTIHFGIEKIEFYNI
ncbi:hypothetical protein Pmani_013279 [Petrolisthes manimaculis]|uniref:Uncharacterized protein n=1 Tax=Petrolisthes manimaculis TaxID=1843537 RepID=A0AAE1PZ22_9EUCA|nr:hypothetical protein Pmani_013279 [Petrolisthes manimaculis]